MPLNRFMPPGAWHLVYTPMCTVVMGGHIYLYDTMRFMEMSRMFDNKHAWEVAHISALDTFCLMMVNLIWLDRLGKFPRLTIEDTL
jgi:hypothetical protein